MVSAAAAAVAVVVAEGDKAEQERRTREGTGKAIGCHRFMSSAKTVVAEPSCFKEDTF